MSELNPKTVAKLKSLKYNKLSETDFKEYIISGNESSYNHYIPKSYIKRFCYNSDDYLCMYDKKEDKFYEKKFITRILGSKNRFIVFNEDGTRSMFVDKKIFNEVENNIPQILDILEYDNQISNTKKRILSKILLNLFLRSKKTYESMINSVFNENDGTEISNKFLREINFRYFNDFPQKYNSFYYKKSIRVYHDKYNRFMLTDSPIIGNPFADDDIPYNLLPISSNSYLSLVDTKNNEFNSIKHIYNIDNQTLNDINFLIIFYSERFIFHRNIEILKYYVTKYNKKHLK